MTTGGLVSTAIKDAFTDAMRRADYELLFGIEPPKRQWVGKPIEIGTTIDDLNGLLGRNVCYKTNYGGREDVWFGQIYELRLQGDRILAHVNENTVIPLSACKLYNKEV